MPQEDRKSTRFIPGLTLGFLCLGLCTTLTHAMWQDEWQAWLIARDSSSLADLFHNLRYEGHPGLWHLALYALSRVTHQAVAMQLFHLIVATAAVYFFLKFSPFTRWQKGLFIFGYFPVFEYAVISRNYALGVLLIFLFCAVYRWAGSRKDLWLAGILFLLCQTSVYGVMISMALVSLLFIEYVLNRNTWGGPPSSGYWAAALIIVALGIAVAVLQLIPPADSGFAVGWQTDLDGRQALRTLTTLWQGYVPIPAIDRHFWGTNILPNQYLQGMGSVFLLIFSACLLIRRPQVLWVYALGTLGLLAFSYTKYPGSLRHHGHLFILLVACLWLAAAGPQREPRSILLRRMADFGRRHRGRFLTGLLWAHLLAAVVALSFACLYPFSGSHAAAQFIRARQLQDRCLVGDADDAAAAVGGYLHRRIYYPGSGRSGSFIIWDQQRKNLEAPDMLRKAKELTLLGREEVVLILNYPVHVPGVPVTLLQQFNHNIVPAENFYIYMMGKDG